MDGATPLNGILGAILGETASQQKQRLEEASKQAKDITGLVRKKEKKPAEETTGSTQPANGVSPGLEPKAGTKRKVEFADEAVELDSSKRARVEDDDG